MTIPTREEALKALGRIDHETTALGVLPRFQDLATLRSYIESHTVEPVAWRVTADPIGRAWDYTLTSLKANAEAVERRGGLVEPLYAQSSSNESALRTLAGLWKWFFQCQGNAEIEKAWNKVDARNRHEIAAASEVASRFFQTKVAVVNDRASPVQPVALEGALKHIQSGITRKVATPFISHGQPSKQDRCQHGQYMYEDCEACIDVFIDEVLAKDTLTQGIKE